MFLRLATVGMISFASAIMPARSQDANTAANSQTVAPANPASALDEPIGQIADMPGGCALLDKDFPGLRQHAMYDFFKSMTLNQIAALSKGQITHEMLAQAQTDLLALRASSSATENTPPVTAATMASTVPAPPTNP